MRAIVVAGGSTDPSDADLLSTADLVIAADGGAAWLAAVGHVPDRLVGDLDSAPAEIVAELEAAGVPVERHPTEKDASDLELAIDVAVAAGATEVTILGALGGMRLDHELAAVLLLADPAWDGRGVTLRIVRGGTAVRALLGPGVMRLDGPPGSIVTLLPLGDDVAGVTTDRLRYALDDEPLRLGRARGLSNVVAASGASVQIGTGTLLIIEGEPT